MNKFTGFWKKNQDLICVGLGTFFMVLAAFGAYNAWQAGQPQTLKIETVPLESLKATSSETQIKIIGNRQSKIYHYDFCPGALKMKEVNKIYFASIEEARKTGFRPAANCPGLE